MKAKKKTPIKAHRRDEVRSLTISCRRWEVWPSRLFALSKRLSCREAELTMKDQARQGGWSTSARLRRRAEDSAS